MTDKPYGEESEYISLWVLAQLVAMANVSGESEHSDKEKL